MAFCKWFLMTLKCSCIYPGNIFFDRKWWVNDGSWTKYLQTFGHCGYPFVKLSSNFRYVSTPPQFSKSKKQGSKSNSLNLRRYNLCNLWCELHFPVTDSYKLRIWIPNKQHPGSDEAASWHSWLPSQPWFSNMAIFVSGFPLNPWGSNHLLRMVVEATHYAEVIEHPNQSLTI